eukprot:2475872-Amphidinium_carterae.1
MSTEPRNCTGNESARSRHEHRTVTLQTVCLQTGRGSGGPTGVLLGPAVRGRRGVCRSGGSSTASIHQSAFILRVLRFRTILTEVSCQPKFLLSSFLVSSRVLTWE